MDRCRDCNQKSTYTGYYEYCDACTHRRVYAASCLEDSSCKSLDCDFRGPISDEYRRFFWLKDGQSMYSISTSGMVTFKPTCAKCATRRDIEFERYTIDKKDETLKLTILKAAKDKQAKLEIELLDHLKAAKDKQAKLEKELLNHLETVKTLKQDAEAATNKRRRTEDDLDDAEKLKPVKRARKDSPPPRPPRYFGSNLKIMIPNHPPDIPLESAPRTPEISKTLDLDLEPGEIRDVEINEGQFWDIGY